MKNAKAKRIIIAAVALTLLISSLFVTLIPASAQGGKGVAMRPIGSGDISTEDYYRLLYSNNCFRENIIYNYEKPDFDFEHFDLNDKVLSQLGASNIAIKALGAIPYMPQWVTSTAGAVLQGASLYRINQNTAKMLNELGESLEEVYNSLSKDIENQTQVLSKDISDAALYLSNQMESEKCIAALKDFNDKAFGGKGYGAWKKELLGAYNQLVFYNEEFASDEDMKEAYDRLYVVASNYSVLASFITANESVEDDSIQDIYFRYYLLRSLNDGDLDPDQAVNECVSFAEELYTTYIFAELCMNICSRYQLECLQKEYGSNFATKGYLLSDSVNSIDRRISFYESIKPFVENEGDRLDSIAAEISKHYVKILNLAESYNVLYQDTYHKVLYNEIVGKETVKSHKVTRKAAADTEKLVVTNNSISVGEVLHLNTIPQNLAASFEQKFSFESSDNTAATVTSTGVVTVKKNKAFTISMLYGDYLVYQMSFSPSTHFSGGDGTKEHPFILSSLDDLKLLADSTELWSSGYHYRLTTDINTSSISQIGNSEVSFDGVFDGDGHTVSGLRGESLFGLNYGTIKNLIIDNVSVTEGGHLNRPRLIVGGVCSYNAGTIENVHLKNSTVNLTNTSALNVSAGENRIFTEVSLFIGGIAGGSNGTIKSCSVDSVTIKGYQTNGTATGAINEVGAPGNNIISMGNIVGYSTGTVSDCLATGNSNYSYIKSVSAFNNYVGIKTEHLCVARFRMGGLVGHNSGTVQRSVAYSNTLTHDWEYDTKNNVTWLAKKKYFQEKDAPISNLVSVNSSVTEKCFDSLSKMSDADKAEFENNGWSFGSSVTVGNSVAKSISIYKNPLSTIYVRDGVLNIAGLMLETDNGEYIIDGYTVEEGQLTQNGERVISINWKGRNASFRVNTACGHTEVSLEPTDKEYDKKLVCTKCNADVVYLEGYSAPLYVNHDHAWDEGSIILHPTHESEGRKIYTCTECGGRREEILFPLTDHLYNQKRLEDRYLAEPKTCMEKAKYYYLCICGAVGTEIYEADVVPHTVGGETYFDEINHWNKCTACGDKANEHQHMFGVWTVITPAEVGRDGERERSCYDCDYKEVASYSLEDVEKEEQEKGEDKEPVSTTTILIIVLVVVCVGMGVAIVIILAVKRSSPKQGYNSPNASSGDQDDDDNDSAPYDDGGATTVSFKKSNK